MAIYSYCEYDFHIINIIDELRIDVKKISGIRRILNWERVMGRSTNLVERAAQKGTVNGENPLILCSAPMHFQTSKRALNCFAPYSIIPTPIAQPCIRIFR
jgi:hypothetical protein